MPTFTATTPYADATYADAYFAKGVHLRFAEWESVDTNTKNAALIQATEMIDRLPNIDGVRADENQANEFPRGDDAEVPINVVNASCEIALELTKGWSQDKELEKGNVASERVGDASRNYFAGGKAKTLRSNHGLPSRKALELLAPYLYRIQTRLERG